MVRSAFSQWVCVVCWSAPAQCLNATGSRYSNGNSFLSLRRLAIHDFVSCTSHYFVLFILYTTVLLQSCYFFSPLDGILANEIQVDHHFFPLVRVFLCLRLVFSNQYIYIFFVYSDLCYHCSADFYIAFRVLLQLSF